MDGYGLFIDIGNTSIKIGIGSRDKIITSYTLPTNTSCSADEIGLQLLQLVHHAEICISKDITFQICLISSVVPSMDIVLRHACNKFFICQTLVVHQDIPVPLENGYNQPLEVGADRLVAAYAARSLFPQYKSIVSVDYGTATTFDCVTDNTYLGGLICPGVRSSLDALSKHTAKLPCIALSQMSNVPVIGKNTDTSLNHGFLFGFVAMTEGLCVRLLELLVNPVTFIATGGFAFDIASYVSYFDAVCPELILDGLRLIWIEQTHTNV